MSSREVGGHRADKDKVGDKRNEQHMDKGRNPNGGMLDLISASSNLT